MLLKIRERTKFNIYTRRGNYMLFIRVKLNYNEILL